MVTVNFQIIAASLEQSLRDAPDVLLSESVTVSQQKIDFLVISITYLCSL